MLKQIDFKDTDELLILGDNIDRGEQNIEVLEFIRHTKNVTSLIGNHEQMMLSEIWGILDGTLDIYQSNWIHNGGESTLTQLIDKDTEKPGYLRLMMAHIRNWRHSKVYRLGERTIICVHAGYVYKEDHEQTPESVLRATTNVNKVWLREDFYINKGLPGTLTIFGHTPTGHIDYSSRSKIWHDKVHGDKICIDCGVYRCGTLGCLRLDDMEEFYTSDK